MSGRRDHARRRESIGLRVSLDRHKTGLQLGRKRNQARREQLINSVHFRPEKRVKQFEPGANPSTHLFVRLKPVHLVFPRHLHPKAIEGRVEYSVGPIT